MWFIQMLIITALLFAVFLLADKISTECHRAILKKQRKNQIKKQIRKNTLWGKK